jgi:hypothetical protein
VVDPDGAVRVTRPGAALAGKVFGGFKRQHVFTAGRKGTQSAGGQRLGPGATRLASEVHRGLVGPAARQAVARGEGLTVWGYGPRCTGKTELLLGSANSALGATTAGGGGGGGGVEGEGEGGLLQHVCADVFAALDALPGGSRRESLVTLQAVRFGVGLECAGDLLRGVDYSTDLKIREDPRSGFLLEKLTRLVVDSEEELHEAVRAAKGDVGGCSLLSGCSLLLAA